MMSSSDEENVGNNDYKGKKKVKRNVTINKKTFESLQVRCEWLNCGSFLKKYNYQFYHHVSGHLKDDDLLGIGEDEEEKYICRWSTCNFQTDIDIEIVRHVKYHAHHAELRALGAFVQKSLNLPECVIPNEYHVLNNVDDSPLICQWSSCNERCLGVREFVDHVCYHIKCMNTARTYQCLWSDCDSSFPRRAKLLDHIKTHTKEHFIACPQCGHTFANKTKFADHCLTQKPLEGHVYQCDYCLSSHPTERILRKHMGQHIHHYKCPFCNMTCNKPSILCKHIRYRHLNYKSFKCSLCEFMCKSKSDLQSHILSHVTGFHTCQESGCSYTTTTQSALKKHIEAVHSGKQRGLFCCHICDKKFTRGTMLTNHLASKHNLKKPPGYSRFQYVLDADGCKRLQTVRLESLDMHDEISDFNPVSEEGSSDNDKQVVYQEDSVVSTAIAVDILGEKGQIISSCIVIPEEDSVPPEGSKILAIGT